MGTGTTVTLILAVFPPAFVLMESTAVPSPTAFTLMVLDILSLKVNTFSSELAQVTWDAEPFGME